MVVTRVIASNQALLKVFFGSNDRLSLGRGSRSASQSEQILTGSTINGSISNIFLLVIVNIMAYKACNAIIVQSDAELSAAEAHGMATGMLCVNEQTESASWLAELLHNSHSVIDENKYMLVRLFEETRRLLASDEFEFDLFLPEDDASLVEQVEALKSWCRGVLFGVGSGTSASNWPKNAREILKDIAEFTKLDDYAEGEEDERAFMEITEYLRSAVLLLRDELGNSSGEPK
jgi:uncharacterized protein YgfB (UPF0149 family)